MTAKKLKVLIVDDTLENRQRGQPEKPDSGRMGEDRLCDVDHCRKPSGNIDFKLDKTVKERDNEEDRDRCQGTTQ